VHSLNDQDKEVHLTIFCQFQRILAEKPELLNKLLMNDEAHFRLHGTVNEQNFCYWSATNHHKLHHCPFMTQKLHFGVLCGPEESLDPTSLRMKMDKPSQYYTEMISEFLAPKLPLNHNLGFQQDGTTAHMAWLHFSISFHSGWFLVLVMCSGLHIRQN
jgi:hypothetical protein